jgi:hypothetical protein
LVKRLVKQLLRANKESEMFRMPLIFLFFYFFIFYFLFFIFYFLFSFFFSFLYFIFLLSLISLLSCKHPYPNGTARTLPISPDLRCHARLLSDGAPSSSSFAAAPVPAGPSSMPLLHPMAASSTPALTALDGPARAAPGGPHSSRRPAPPCPSHAAVGHPLPITCHR